MCELVLFMYRVCGRSPNSVQALCVTSCHVECHFVLTTMLMKGSGNDLRIDCFRAHTLQPLLSGQHTHTHTHTHRGLSEAVCVCVCVCVCCKHVLECIRTRLKQQEEEKENTEEVIFSSWRSFLFRDINAAKNNRRLSSRCAFSSELKKKKKEGRKQEERGKGRRERSKILRAKSDDSGCSLLLHPFTPD